MFYSTSGLHEECGVCGVVNVSNAAEITGQGLYHLQHRGQTGTGIAAFNGFRLQRERGLGLVADVFDKNNMSRLKGTTAIGHVRYATAGANALKNVQPLIDGTETFAYAHNGHLLNAIRLKQELEQEGAVFQTDSDSEVLAHLVQRRKEDSFHERLKGALNEIRGAFVYLILKDDQLFVARDPNGFRPVSIGKLEDGYIVASESSVLDAVGAVLVHEVAPGELVTVNKTGFFVERFASAATLAVCSMEFIYFARPDSIISGVTVYSARKNMGRFLAEESYVNADLVLGVPDSGIPAAIGFAERSGIPFEAAIIKNKYATRTFIQPSQEQRDRDVHNKFTVVKEIVKGKRVVLVDDSVVRGTTMKKLVKMLLEAGVKEVHLRVASPPFAFPCFFGIDVPSKDQLIACQMTIPEMTKFFHTTSLAYLSVENLVKSVDLRGANGEKLKDGGICISYFNGEYPVELYDYAEIR